MVKLLFRILLSPLWLPFVGCYKAFQYGMAFVDWLINDITWQRAKERSL